VKREETKLIPRCVAGLDRQLSTRFEALLYLVSPSILTSTPGAAVLAHSLRDNGTTKKLAALITQDSLKPETILQLKVRAAGSFYNFL